MSRRKLHFIARITSNDRPPVDPASHVRGKDGQTITLPTKDRKRELHAAWFRKPMSGNR